MTSAARAAVVAIDGPAAAGKSSVARRLARDLGFAYLDTGAMYRAATYEALRRGLDLGEVAPLAAMVRELVLSLTPDGRVSLGGHEVTAHLRTEAVNAGVSLVAAVPEVRSVMVAHQRRFAAQNERVVAEGRDIGTVVFPDAAAKIYLDAGPSERARRRLGETGGGAGGAGEREDLERVAEGLERRDRLDSTRAASPLKAAPDAWRLDTTHLTLEQVSAQVLAHVRSALRLGAGG